MIFNYYEAAFNTAENEYTHYTDKGIEFSIEDLERFWYEKDLGDLHPEQLKRFAIGQRFCIGAIKNYPGTSADFWVERVF